ncbi:MAG: N-acetylmuramoyl-L-alanine amidase [Nitrospinota bacterium]
MITSDKSDLLFDRKASFCIKFLYQTILLILLSTTVFQTTGNATVIALDPGHGGSDLGVTDSAGFLEKNITLKVANLIVSKLRQEDNLRFIIVRNIEEESSVLDRITRANRSKVDIYIALHLAAAKQRLNRPLTIFIDKPVATKLDRDDLFAYQNRKHSESSRLLATTVQEELSQFYGINDKIVVRKSNRLFLGEINSAAIIVEMIDFADSGATTIVSDKEKLDQLAQHFYNAIQKVSLVLNNKSQDNS